MSAIWQIGDQNSLIKHCVPCDLAR